METTVLKLAAELCGGEEEDALLGALCNAAETAWKRRLKAGTAGEGCEDALRCAAAFTAAAEFCDECIQETVRRQPGHWYGLAFEEILRRRMSL